MNNRDPQSALPPRLHAEKLLTTEAVAEIMDVNEKTVRNRMKDAGLPFIRIGRSVRFRESVVFAWIEARETRSGSKEPA